MKKLFSLIFSISLFVTIATPAFAFRHEDRINEIRERNEERRQIREEVLKDLRAKIQERRATHEARLAEHRKELIRKFWERLNRRILAGIARLEKLIARIESRIAKIEEGSEDIDTTPIKKKLEEAKDLLLDARAEKEAADLALEEVLASENPKEAFKVIRDEVHKIKRKLVEVQRILVHVIGDIKGLRVGRGAGEVSPTLEPTVSE